MRALALAVIMLAVSAGTATSRDMRSIVVVELFTSQGCRACRTAESLLGELARHEDVLALSLHVDYWDYIGWNDVFARPAYSERQHRYSVALRQRYIYTPQVIVNGLHSESGERRDAVLVAVEGARASERSGPLLAIADDGAKRTLRVGWGTITKSATIWLVGFDRKHETAVTAGENEGLQAINYNVVRAMIPIGTWSGPPTEVAVDFRLLPSSCDGAAVLVQVGGVGPIVAALPLDLPKP